MSAASGPRRARWLAVFSLAAFSLALAAIATCAQPAQASTSRQWLTGDLDAAIATAKKANKRLFVKFEASWCGPCKRLGKLLEEQKGQAVMKGVLGVRVDFDSPANRKYIERYVVLGLPTVMVIAPDGTQVSRINGYDNSESWLAEARAAKAAQDPLPALEGAVRQKPSDPKAVLKLGKALLVRKETKRGLALLERVGWLTHRNDASRAKAELAAEALFVLGRFHHRVRRDPATAQHVWRELATRYPTSDFVGGAWWWYARSQHELGRDDVALAALRARVAKHPRSMSALGQWVSFSVKHKLTSEATPADAAINAAESGASKTELERLKAMRGKLAALRTK